MTNISRVSDKSTANTHISCATQRAENLAALGTKKVLELCVGPSFETLEKQYQRLDIEFFGNDIDYRWKKYYPSKNWIMGDCTTLALPRAIDSVVFAPPLSFGCSGKRSDALSIDEVFPSYINFLNLPCKITTLVLPARSFSTYRDKTQFYKLLHRIYSTTDKNIEVIPLYHKVRKYVDIYIYD